MKKFLTVLAMMLVLIQLLALVFVNTAAASTYHESLITHWDFEGTSPLVDKAVGGVSSDTLTIEGNGVILENGVAYVSDAVGTYITATIAENTDLSNFIDKTIVVKGMWQNDPVDGRNIVAAAFSAGEKKWAWHLQNASTNNALLANGFVNDPVGSPVTMDAYRIFVITFAKIEDSDNYRISYYQSTKEVPTSAADFEKLLEVEGAWEAKLTGTSNMYLGRRYDHIDPSKGEKNLHTYFDDVKVYSDVLTLDQIAADVPKTEITPATTEATTVATTEGTTAAATTAAATTKAATTAAATTAAATTAATTAAEEGGCGGVIAIPAVALVTAVASACVIKRKRTK